MADIKNITDYSNSAKTWTVVEMLKEVIRLFESGEIDESAINKGAVILLDDSIDEEGDKTYDVLTYAANLDSCSCGWMLEVAKTSLIYDMGYGPTD